MKLSEEWANSMNSPYAYHSMQSPVDTAYCDNCSSYGHFSYACQRIQEPVAAFQGYTYDSYYSAYEQQYHHYNTPPSVCVDPTPTDMQDIRDMLMKLQKGQEHLIAQFDQLAFLEEPRQPDQLPSQPTEPHQDVHLAFPVHFQEEIWSCASVPVPIGTNLVPIGLMRDAVEGGSSADSVLEGTESLVECSSTAEAVQSMESSIMVPYPSYLNRGSIFQVQSHESDVLEHTTDSSEDSYDISEDMVVEEVEPELYCAKKGTEEVDYVAIDWHDTLSAGGEQEVEEKAECLPAAFNVVASKALINFDSCAGDSVSSDLLSRFEDLKEPADDKHMDNIAESGPIGWTVYRSVYVPSAPDLKVACTEVLSLGIPAAVSESVYNLRRRKLRRYAYKEIHTESDEPRRKRGRA